MSYSSDSVGQLDTSLLEDRCWHFLVQGLAPSTRKSYASGRRKFYDFCRHAGRLHQDGSPCPAEEWTLCLFVSFLADSVQHSSIKVYLSAVRSLHIEQGFPDPLINCLRLQRVLRGIKRSQGSSATQRLPVTDSILFVIHQALDPSSFDHCMFWAACTLGYFGFLRQLSLPFRILPVFPLSIICRCLMLQWILTLHRLAYAFGSKHPRQIPFGRVASFTLAWAGLRSALSKPCSPIYLGGGWNMALYLCSSLANRSLVQC